MVGLAPRGASGLKSFEVKVDEPNAVVWLREELVD